MLTQPQQTDARTEAAIYAEGTHYSTDYLYSQWKSACESAGEWLEPQRFYQSLIGQHSYRFATDSTVGTHTAKSFEAAKQWLASLLTDEALNDGAWGWIEDTDGERYILGEAP